MVVGKFVKFLTLPNVFDQKQLSVFFHWGEFAELTFAKFLPARWFVNVDPTIWLDGARPSNNCILPSILDNMRAQQCTNPQNTFASVKINKFYEIPFYK
jgi:hypothetical protein